MTVPLLEGLDGVEKMSKSLENYVGITEPPNEIYGKIMSISDPLMFRYYELLTDIPVSKIENWRKEIRKEQIHPKDLKSNLAKMIVADFWGEKEAESVAQEFERVFKHKEIPEDIEQIDIPAHLMLLVDLLVERNILPSRGEAKRMVRQGGVYLDGIRVEDIESKLDFSKKNEYILKIGKRRFFKLVGK